MMDTNCPCGSGNNYTACCEPILTGKKNAATAEALMRSRYVAFTLANVNYLMLSHHSSTRPNKERKSIAQWAKSVKWIGLTILNSQDGQPFNISGTVEFKALYIEDGSLSQIHEKSLFQRENEKWVYISGVMLD
jgi:SEC-C motif-containing protein